MLLKLETYLDLTLNPEFSSPDDIVMMKSLIQEQFNLDVKKSLKTKASGVTNLISSWDNMSFELLSKEEVFERMRTKGKT